MDVSNFLGKYPVGTTGAVLLGLSHAPRLTFDLMAAGATLALGQYADQLEQDQVQNSLKAMMSTVGPWQHGAANAERSQEALRGLPTDARGVVLVDPYYFDQTMRYTDETFGEGDDRLYIYAYRLRPVAVFALNYNPMSDGTPLLVESVVLVAFMQGTDLLGRPSMYTAMWREGLPLGVGCPFSIPKWGQLRRAHDVETHTAALAMFEDLFKQANETHGTSRPVLQDALRSFKGEEFRSTPVEYGFPSLKGTVWYGNEPFPWLDEAEYEMLGSDLRARQINVPLWMRPMRGGMG